MSEEQKRKFIEVMHEIQSVWDENQELVKERRSRINGIRSSQIAAVIAYLIQKDIIK